MPTQAAANCLETRLFANGLVVRFTGSKVRLSDDHVRILEENLDALCGDDDCDELVIDLNNIDTVASSALARFEMVHQKLAARGTGFKLVEVYPHVYEIFEASRLIELFDVQPVTIGTPAATSEM